jgi:hypothetical protein
MFLILMAVPMNVSQIPPLWQVILRGILPVGSSILAAVTLLWPEKRRSGFVASEISSAPGAEIFPGRTTSGGGMARSAEAHAAPAAICLPGESLRPSSFHKKSLYASPIFRIQTVAIRLNAR